MQKAKEIKNIQHTMFDWCAWEPDCVVRGSQLYLITPLDCMKIDNDHSIEWLCAANVVNDYLSVMCDNYYY